MDDTRRAVVLALAATIILSIAFSSVFVYYPITAQISPVETPVKLGYGSNAGRPDLSNTISVTIGSNNASATITIHPTYQVSYYRNITIIKNTDSKAYKVMLNVSSTMNGLPANSKAKLYVFAKGHARGFSGWPIENLEPALGNYITSLDLTTTSTTSEFDLTAGAIVEIDILIYIPEGTSPPSSATANIYLRYTPS
ncbi:MAG: hypothetical protein NDF58_08275 [archaeon YNP-LCB-024-027]|nr:hypothetical protein [Candidatus Culexarchaeum yellowstonense]